jgi:hypothetical protein
MNIVTVPAGKSPEPDAEALIVTVPTPELGLIVMLFPGRI